MAAEKHALILGASGISGWALMNQALSYPTSATFKSVTGTTNRPTSVQEAYLPNDPRLRLVSGIDFSRPEAEVKSTLSSKIPNLNVITHVFFGAYMAKTSYEELTGGKAYGVEFPDQVNMDVPLKESLPRVDQPASDNIFYYPQYDILKTLSAKAKWTFTEVRPDVIVGFVPNTNAMDGARGLAIYLTLYRHSHGDGAEVPFIGTEKSWNNKHTDTFQDLLARFEIYAALHPEQCGNGESFNLTDGPVITWSEKWPVLCRYFGLKGVGPRGEPFSPNGFVDQNKGKWQEVEKTHGLRQGLFEKYDWNFIEGIIVAFDFDRQFDMTKTRAAGFVEARDTPTSWTTAFDRLKEAKIIP